jgi:hypothetical protein
MANKLFIGIDPAFRSNGFAMCIIDISDKTVLFKMFKAGFLDFVGWFLHESPETALFCVENSNLSNVTFWTHKDKKTKKLLTAAQAKYNRNAVKISPKELAKVSRNVGKNQAISQNVVDLLNTKYPVVNISPKEKGKKWSDKTAQAYLYTEKLKTTKKTTNQDERDALLLAKIAKQKPYLAQKVKK